MDPLTIGQPRGFGAAQNRFLSQLVYKRSAPVSGSSFPSAPVCNHALFLILITALIFALGLLMVFDTTAAEVLDRAMDISTHHALIKQLSYAFIGGIFAAGVWFLGYENVLKLSPFLLIFGVILLILVFIPPFGQQINGAYRWISAGRYTIQPSEFVKLFIPIYFIHALTSRRSPLFLRDFLKLLGILFVPIALILIEPDNGTVVIILMTLIALCFLTKIRWIYWALPLLVMAFLGGVVAVQRHHVPERIKIYLHPELDLRGKGHQPHQARIAAGSGKLFGKGVAGSMQKLNYLPEARSDYIAAIFAEEYGFLGILVLVLLYMTMGYLGFSLASRAMDLRAFYLISILTFIICFQAFLNLGVVSGLLPSKGTNLPFFSQGGSSLLSNFAAISMILSAAKRKYCGDDSHRCRRDRRAPLSRSSLS